MRPRIHALAIPSELGDFSDEVRRVYLELGRAFGSESLAGECAPALEARVTDDRLELSVRWPGRHAAAMRVMGKGDSVPAGCEKSARRGRAGASFHLDEHGDGRFARVIRLERAYDTAQGKA